MKRPDDLFLSHTYIGFLVTLVQSLGTPDCPIDIPTTLKELKICLSNPNVDKLQIAHTGMQVWFKQFEDPVIQSKLMQEERESERSELTPMQSYLRGLTSGIFREILQNPFFLQAMSEVALPFPQVERIIAPFRNCLLTLKSEQREFDLALPFVSELLPPFLCVCLHTSYICCGTSMPEKQLHLGNPLGTGTTHCCLD